MVVFDNDDDANDDDNAMVHGGYRRLRTRRPGSRDHALDISSSFRNL